MREGSMASMIGRSRDRTVLSGSAFSRVAVVSVVLAVLWLAVAWAVGVP